MKKKLNRRTKKLVKAGLFSPLPTQKPATTPKRKTAAAAKQRRERKPVVFHSKGELTVTELKQRDITIDDPFDGTANRDAADGWGEFDANPELFVAAVCILPTNDGPKKLYRMQVKSSVVQAKRKRVANLLRDIERSNAKAAKRRVRAMLVMMGKHSNHLGLVNAFTLG